MEAANFDQYEKNLAENQFLGGQQPSAADREAFELVKSAPPKAEAHPNTFAWFVLVQRFSDAARNAWAGATAAPAKGGKTAAAPAKKEEPKKEAKKADDDEMDLFGDDDEDEEAAAALKAQKEKAAAATAAKAKATPIAKSLILFEVKPYEAETNLDDLAAKILKIEMDGLFWKTEYKKVPIAFGVEKIVIGCVIEDAKVSADDLQEAIEAFEDEVQSVDIAAFNKI